MNITKKMIDRKIAHLGLTVHKAEGVCYFVCNKTDEPVGESIYVPFYNSLSLERWEHEAIDAASQRPPEKTFASESKSLDFDLATELLNRVNIYFPKVDRLNVLMDLELWNGQTKTNFVKLLVSDEISFKHDIAGILNHVNRKELTVDSTFLPICNQ